MAEWTDREGGYLHQKFAILTNRPFDDPADAEALCAALKSPRADELDGDDDPLFRSYLEPARYYGNLTIRKHA